MNNNESPKEYMLLFRSSDWHKDLSLEEMQSIMNRTYAWFDKLSEAGKFKAAQPLIEEGRIISGKTRKSTVIDGPFAESKESVAGYLILNVDSLEEALEIAREWPILDYGSSVEVRPIAEECSHFRNLPKQLAETFA